MKPWSARPRPYLSPYVFCAADPVNMVDPDGRSPIFDKYGYLLGCDDEGLQGMPVIMNKEDFSQGMSHVEAVSVNKGADYITNKSDYFRYLFTYLSLSSRPDWDGKLTLRETIDWYRNGCGRPLFVDSSQINLGGISMSDIKRSADHMFNLLLYPYYVGDESWAYPESAFVYGNIKVSLDSSGNIILGNDERKLDEYNFEKHGYSGKTSFLKTFGRNIETVIAKIVHGRGHDFNIYTYGYGRIK